MKQHDKFMAELHRLLEKQDFKSEEEVQQFMNGIMKDGMPPVSPDDLSDPETARELVFAAYEASPDKAKECIEMALLLDPNCIEAYEFLGATEDRLPVSIVFYEKAVAIGRELFGGEYLEKHRGYFWGFHETRSFMRCLQQQADCLYALGKVKESVAILEEMIELNPNDNQGVRDLLLLFLTQLGAKRKFKKYDKMFEEDMSAFACFTRALFAFKTEGETQHSNQLLSVAVSTNKYISRRLTSQQAIINVPDGYTVGSKEEATCYAQFAARVWEETDGALQWLKRHTTGSSKK